MMEACLEAMEVCLARMGASGGKMEADQVELEASQEKIRSVKAMHVLPFCRPRLMTFYTEPLKE
jgi:hypothetical protein